MDENEIKGVAEAMEELRKTGNLSAETLAKLGGNGTAAYKALEKYTQKLVGATSAMGSMAKSVAQGEGTFASLGSTIVGLTGVVGKLASAIPLVGGAAKALAEGVGEASKFILDQLDIMAKNYQTLGDASAGAADGVDGLLRQFNQLGNYSLPAFSKAVKANTLGLAALQGTAAAGAEELSKVSGALTTGDAAKRFLKLGMSLDAVGDQTTAYLATSARYGLLQGATTEELTKKTQNYIEEVDKIARLTGQTREAQAKEAQKSLVDARFRAKLADMAANGQSEQAEELRKYVEGLGGAAGDAARALATGIPLTKEAASANLFANDAIRQNTLAIQEGKRATTAISDTQQALADGTVRFGKQIMYAGDQFGGVAVQAYDTKAILDEQNKLMATGLTREQAIEAIQKKQMTASGKNTEQFTNAQLATANASKSLQSLGFSLAEKAIPAVDAFASGLDKVTGFINEKFGVGGTKSTPAGMNRGPAGGPAGMGFVGGGDADRVLATIRARESGGNYSAQAKGSTASGAYQFIDSTWQSLTKKYGMGGEFKSAKMAPKDIQDAIAKAYVNDILKQAGGDVSKVPLAWYTGNIQGKMSQSALAANNGLTPEAYQQNWMSTYSKTGIPSGPSGGYQSPMAGVDPASAGAGTAAQSQQASNKHDAGTSSTSLIKQLAELNQTQKNLLEVNKKILQRQA
jgi:hypothetical protein